MQVTAKCTSGGGAELRVTDGYSATVPLYAFWYNNNTGIGNPAANTTSFIQNGSEKVRIDSGGRLQIGASNNTGSNTKFVVGFGNNINTTAIINTGDVDQLLQTKS